VRGSELVHFNGQYHTQTGRALAPAIAREVPALGSIIAYELESKRRESDTFPTYFSSTLGSGFAGSLGAGFLPARFSGVDLSALTVFDTFGGGSGDAANKVLQERWGFLGGLSEMVEGERKSLGSRETDYRAYYQDAFRVLNDPR